MANGSIFVSLQQGIASLEMHQNYALPKLDQEFVDESLDFLLSYKMHALVWSTRVQAWHGYVWHGTCSESKRRAAIRQMLVIRGSYLCASKIFVVGCRTPKLEVGVSHNIDKTDEGLHLQITISSSFRA